MSNRRFLRILGLVVGFAAVLLAAFLIFLQTATAKRLAFIQLQKILAANGVLLEGAGFDYGLLDFRLSLSHPSVRAAAAPDLPQVLSADRLSASIGLLDLIGGRYRVRDLTITNPIIQIVIDKQGRNNIPHPQSSVPPSAGPAIDWLILKMRASDGALTVDDSSRNLRLQFADWDLAVDGDSLSGMEKIGFQTKKLGEARYNDKSLNIQTLAAHLALNPKTLKLDVLDSRFSSDLADMTLAGTAGPVDDPVLDLKIVSTVRLKPTSQFLAIDQKIAGDLQVDASVSGRLNRLKVAGDIRGDGLNAEAIAPIALAADFTYDAAGNRAGSHAIQLRIPGLTLHGAGDLALTAEAGESTADIQIDSADLDRISRTLKLPVAIAARATGRLRGQWPGMDFARATADGRFQVAPELSASGGRSVPRVPVEGDITLRARDGNAIVTTDSLQSDALSISGQISLNSSRALGGALHVNSSNLGQTLIQAAGWTGSHLPDGLRLSGALDANVEPAGTLAHPQVLAMVSANDLQLNDLRHIQFDTVAEYTPAQIDIHTLGLQWEGAALTGAGTIGLVGASPALNASFDLADTAIHPILAAFGSNDVPLEGNVSLTGSLGGTIQSPAVAVTAAASALQAYGEAFGTLSAAARFENQTLQVDRLSLNKEDSAPLLATGSYDTTQRKYSISVDADALSVKRLVLPQGSAAVSQLTIHANGSGTVDNPTGAVRLTAEKLQLDDETLGSVELTASLANHQAEISASAPFYGITGKASIATLYPYPASVGIRISDSDIAHIPLKQLEGLSGHVTAAIDGTGDLSELRNGEGRVSIEKLNLSWRDHLISNDGAIAVQFANHELAIVHAAIRMDESTVAIAGNVPVDSTSMGEISVEGQTNLANLANLIPSGAPITTAGQLEIHGRLRGNLKRIDPDIAIAITQASFASAALPAPVTGITVRAAAKDGRLTVEQLDGQWAGASIRMQGEAPFAWLPPLPVAIPRPPAASRLSLAVDQFKLSGLLQLPQDVQGTLSLKIEGEAALPQLDAVQARLTLSALRLQAGPYGLEQAGESEVELRNSIATVRHFELSGPQTQLRLSGTANLQNPMPLDARFEGTTDAAILALFTSVVRATGAAAIDIAATGSARQPILNGFVELQNGQALIKDPRIAAENVQVRLDLGGGRLHVTRLEGLINGGAIQGEGDVQLFGASASPAGLTVTGDGVFFEFPAGVKTVSNARLSFSGDARRPSLSGNVDIVEGSYTDPLTLDRGLMRYLESGQSTTVTGEQSLLDRTNLNIGLRTLSPLVVDNNIAHGDINMELQLLGTVEHPGLTGRIDVEEGAELSLRERKYSVDRGVITFINERGIEPVLDLEATTSASGYNITMQVSGDATRKINTVLTSDPQLPEADIVSVLATGRTLENAGGAGVAVAKEQVLSYVAGELGTSLTEGVGRALGLNQVRIEPSLIASEAEPTARLTIGKDITRQLNFVYSMNLRNSSDQIWIADYDITRRFSARGLRQNDSSYRFQFQHEVLFGLSSETQGKTKPAVRRKIGAIHFSGATHWTTQRLSDALGLKTGKPYDFFSVQNGRRQLEKLFANDDRLEAQIAVDRSFESLDVDLTFRIKEGPKVQLVFDGWTVSGDLTNQIRQVWSDGVIDTQRIADVTELIEVQLVRERYLGSHIEGVVETPDADTKRALFHIQLGVRFDDVPVEFEGVQKIPQDDLRKVLKDGGFFDRDLEKRKQAVPLIERQYQDRGYIDVHVQPPQDELDNDRHTARTVIRVTEGSQYHFAALAVDNNSEFSQSEILDRLAIRPGDIYTATRVQEAVQALQDLYRKKGYDNVEIQYRQVKDLARQTMAVTFDVQENLQRILRAVDIENNYKTSRGLIRSQIEMEPGDIVSYDKLSQARIKLYDTGAFSFVEIVAEPSSDRSGLHPNQTAVRLRVRVRESQPWQVRYGGFYDTERGPGGVVDVSNHNMLGNARIVGVQTRYDSDLREVRLYLTQPAVRRFPVKSLFSAFSSHEIVTNTVTSRIGFSPTLEYRFQKNNVIAFGYRFEKVDSFETIAGSAIPVETRSRIAGLTSSITLDTRDDPLDATRGRFNSHSIEWSPAFLGSQERAIKYFGQYFAYFPFGKATVVPWSGVLRNRVVLALGARVGIARGFGGQDVAQTERFLAGGGTTVRGFGQNQLGPLDSSGVPTGGNAMLVLNGEWRFPLYKFVDGVTFADAGNVYGHLSDFSLTQLRESSGFGLRIRTPYVVLRLDYGLKLNRQPGESRGKFFFSIGQAF